MTLARTRTLADLKAVAPAVLARIAQGAAEREATRTMPHAQVREFAAAGLGTWRVPAADGGPDAGMVDVIRFLIDLAEADPNVTQGVRSHLAFVERLRRLPDPELRDRWFPRVLAGDLVGAAGGELGAPQGVMRSRIFRRDGIWRVTGDKFYSTGTLFSEWVAVTALDENGEHVSAVVPTDRPGVELVDDWDGIGQRLTASGSTLFRDVEILPDEFLPSHKTEGTRPPISPFFQLFLASVQVGIARNAVADAVGYAQRKARPIKHSGVASSLEDPYVRHAVGDMAARTYGAEAAVLRAAEAIAATDGVPGHEDQDLVRTASLEVSQAHLVATEAALAVSQALFEVGGASTAQRVHNLDRHWRNSRTVANHNPRAHKAAVVGAWLLSGEEPPTTGFF
ncbi:acyl-CoA dehydrogenase family protein [Pseudonocardia ailaonensis]|uniref:Acyl-CoA dehydrogenase family protein n=1 Tax=Pseudonocardia ailaonensis TaxID=367279 RepID=A0ABN2N5M7_9PSEU